MYVREDLAFRLRNDINTGGQECLWIELIRDKCKPTLLLLRYFPNRQKDTTRTTQLLY